MEKIRRISRKESVLLFIVAFSVMGFVLHTSEKTHATRIKAGKLENLYRVDAELYRSEQPKKSDFAALNQLGVKSVINLRTLHKDNRKAKKASCTIEHCPVVTKNISYEDVVEILKLIEKSPKPVLIHCWHGSDRTGCVVAAYRMCRNNWTKEEAIKEFLEEDYGYHANAFPNNLELLQGIDVERLKADVK